MTFAIISLLVGMALGQRFKVLVLVPAILLALVLAIGAGIAQADGLWSTVMMSVTAATSLQIGYFVGIGIRRASRLRSTPLPGSARRDGLPAH